MSTLCRWGAAWARNLLTTVSSRHTTCRPNPVRVAWQDPEGCRLLSWSVLFYNHAQLLAQNSNWIHHRDKNHTCGEWESGFCAAKIYRIFDALLGKEEGLYFSSLTSPPVQTLKLSRNGNGSVFLFFFPQTIQISLREQRDVYTHIYSPPFLEVHINQESRVSDIIRAWSITN